MSDDERESDRTFAAFFKLVAGVYGLLAAKQLFSLLQDNSTLKTLKQIPFTPLEEVEKQVDKKKRPVYVKTAGYIHPLSTPYFSEKSGKLKPVVFRQKIQWGTWPGIPGVLPSSKFVLCSTVQKTAYEISNQEGTTTKIKMPFWDSQPEPTISFTDKEKVGHVVPSFIARFFNVQYPYLMQTEERIIPMGEELFVLAKVGRNKEGKLEVLKSSSLWTPGVLSLQSEEELTQKLEQNIQDKTKSVAFMLTVAGCCFGISYMY